MFRVWYWIRCETVSTGLDLRHSWGADEWKTGMNAVKQGDGGGWGLREGVKKNQ